MKRAWVAVFVVALAVPGVALAQGPVAAWCGGSYGAEGTNFGTCVNLDRDVPVAGQSSGVGQGISVQTRPEFPSSLVTFENGRVMFLEDRDGRPTKRELHFPAVAHTDRGEFQGAE